MSLTAKYAPRRFSEVVGQERHVRLLSRLAQTRQGRSLLLHGAVGSGKTTLARLYSDALNCAHPDVDGSACGSCERCMTGAFYREVDSPNITEADLKQAVNSLRALNFPGVARILFVDEAHALEKPWFDFLLKTMEDEPEFLCIFATTDHSKIPDAIKSRAWSLPVNPLSADEAIAFLRQICEQEQIVFNEQGLSALAFLAKCQPRDMLNRLDQIRDEGVSAESVRSNFGLPETQPLVDYFKALGEGDAGRQIELFMSWNEDVSKKVSMIQNLILAIFIKELRGRRIVVDPFINSISSFEIEAIVTAFRNRLGDSLPQVWDQMLSFWQLPSDMTDEALNLKVMSFHDLVNVRTDRPKSVSASSKAHGKCPKGEKSDKFLSDDQVREVIAGAAFMSQAHGVRFNVRLSIWFSCFGCADSTAASDLLSEFTKDLREAVGDLSVHRFASLEHDHEKGFVGRIVAHIPEHWMMRLRPWLNRWRADRREDHGAAIECETAERAKEKFHLESLRWFCGSLSPDANDWDPIQQKCLPLRDLLKIPKRWRREAGVISGKRIRASEGVTATAINGAASENMGIVSAFAMRSWDSIGGAWELKEHMDRADELKRLPQDRPLDPLKRKRSWVPFWTA